MTLRRSGQKLGLSTKFKPDGTVKSKGCYYKDKRYGQWLVAFKGFIETRFYEGDTAVKTRSYTDKAGKRVSHDFQESSEDYERMVDLVKGSSLRKS